MFRLCRSLLPCVLYASGVVSDRDLSAAIGLRSEAFLLLITVVRVQLEFLGAPGLISIKDTIKDRNVTESSKRFELTVDWTNLSIIIIYTGSLKLRCCVRRELCPSR
ncbi:hypothetical protein EDD18DRAFT_1141320 [Armillaria luteobubalina]|uniref:Uncharacterized protein n=1 Tax=Armillaria luteobubalina TaxID=153913 RepID=A0AA39QGK4_9AGAR|nr:hypothetical protein EDD18DRAFT_1141320 [Armillaria luteobubalina]